MDPNLHIDQIADSAASTVSAPPSVSLTAEVLPYPEVGVSGNIDENIAVNLVSDEATVVPNFSEPDENNDYANLTIEDLFGKLFEVREQWAVDPVLIDTRSILLHLFGDHVHEGDVSFDDDKYLKLQKEMADNKAAARIASVENLFGDAGATALLKQHIGPFGCLQSSLPNVPDLSQYKELWLLDMPKIAPNRQTLHMEPQPFYPSQCEPLNSTDRMLYTTQNVTRWAHHKGTNTFMSNARVVRWSDGSVTLNVGSDFFVLQPSKENALTMLACPIAVRKGAAEVPAMVSVLNPKKHFFAEGTLAPSVEEAIIAESARSRSLSTQHHLAFTTSPLPKVNWAKMSAARTPLEEYVIKEYNRRLKLIEQRKKDGRPITLTEQMEMENELLQRLQSLRADTLWEKQQEEEREATQRAATAQRSSRRRRFERNTELEGGEYTTIDDERVENVEENYEDSEENNFEAMYEELQRRQQLENDVDNAERMRRIRQREDAQIALYEPLMEALRGLLSSLPMRTNAYGSVQGTLDFLSTGSFSAGVIAREVPLMMEEVASECPNVDLSAVRHEFSKIFP